MKAHVLAGTALLLFLGVSPGPAAAAPQAPPPAPEQQTTTATPQTTPSQAQTPAAQPAAAEQQTMSCGDCHDQAKAFTSNPHAHGKVAGGVVPNSVCESCHGNGTAHMDAGGDKTLIFRPAGQAGADKTCLSCHDKNTNRISRHGGMHANSATVNCLTCHSIHSSEKSVPHLLVKSELNLCSTCHRNQAASFRNKPFGHRIGRGGMGCTSCHEPHGRPSRESLRTTLSGDRPCMACHSDKRGPFVFQHGAFALGECTNCHEVHGSNNPKMLVRSNVYQLCIECHSPITSNTLGSQPPSFHNLSQPRFRNCTTCHVAIHGSNRDPQLLK